MPKSKKAPGESLTLDQVIRALKDEDYRKSLDRNQVKDLPENPSGVIRMLDGHFNLAAENQSRSLSWFTGTCGHVCQVITPEFKCEFVPACW